MRRKSLAMIAFVLVAACPVHGAEYWPTGIDAVYTYVNDAGVVLEVTYDHNGYRTSHYSNQDEYVIKEQYIDSSDGDALLTYSEAKWVHSWDPDYYRQLGSAFKFVDLPLVAGGTWFSYANTTCCYGSCPVMYGFSVLAPTVVTVPAGTFSVVQVSATNLGSCMPYPQTGVYSLERNIGPVILPGGYKLVSIDSAVPSETTCWGDLKALYR